MPRHSDHAHRRKRRDARSIRAGDIEVPVARALGQDYQHGGSDVGRTLADYWAPRINAQWQKSVEGIIGVGRHLIAAKEACEHGEFARLFTGHANAVNEPVPFSLNTAERLMRVARHPVLSNSAHVQTLPQSWGTLYELSHLDDDTLAAGIKAGEITPEMTRSQAAAMRADPIERPAAAGHEAMADAMKNAVTKFIGQLTTPEQFDYVLSRLDRLTRFISEQQDEISSAVPVNSGPAR